MLASYKLYQDGDYWVYEIMIRPDTQSEWQTVVWSNLFPRKADALAEVKKSPWLA